MDDYSRSVIPPVFHVVGADDDALPRFTLGPVFTDWELAPVRRC